jgi:adenosylhomocysteine nucleosidase
MNQTEIQACILTALKQEARPYLKALRQKKVFRHRSLRVYMGYISDIPVAVAVGGVRRKKAAKAAKILVELFPQAFMVMSGTAGGLDKRLKIGDTVVATESINHDQPEDETAYPSASHLLECCQNALEKNPPKQQVLYGRLATGDAFVKKNNRAAIIERFAPLCVDMETAAAAQVCHVNAVPFIAVRSITDIEENVSALTFVRNVAFAARNSFVVVVAMLAITKP